MATVDIQPEFQVEAVTGNFTRNITVIKETHLSRLVNGVEKITTVRKLEKVVDTFTDGFMLYYPQGHSLFVAADDHEQLMQLGVTRDPKYVDMESGEVVPENYHLSPKEIVARKERNRPRATGGLSDVMDIKE